MKQILDHYLQSNKFHLSDEITEQLIQFMELVLFWNQKINLTAHLDAEALIEKDIIEALYLGKVLGNQVGAHGRAPLLSCLDMGAGAGLIGISLKILYPELSITFLEANRRKINFIRQVIRELALVNTSCIQTRAESFPSELQAKHNICFSRATWKLKDFLKYAHYYVQNKGQIIFMAGPSQKMLSAEYIDIQGLEGVSEINYEILPKKLPRKFFIYRKTEGNHST